MGLFEKVFSWHEFIEIFDDKEQLTLIWNKSGETRNSNNEFLTALHNKFCCTEYTLVYKADEGVLQYDKDELPLRRGIASLINKLEMIPVLVNITTMNLQVLGFLLKALKNSSVTEVYCMYTEPKCYAVLKNSEKDIGCYFDLHKSMKSVGSLIGYVSMNVEKKPAKWVPFLGFEGDRAQQVREIYDFKECIPIITLPSYRPLWQNFIIRQNLSLLDSIGGNSLRYVEADSFVSAYEELEYLSAIYHDCLLRVSPFGTKINAMGIFLYALNHEGEIDIVYDNPIEGDAAISEEVGKTHIFDISEFMISATNNKR